jgi:hypothetical protein
VSNEDCIIHCATDLVDDMLLDFANKCNHWELYL